MAGNSKIEWTEQTWNPFAGCAVLSPGCTNCYAMKMAARLDAMGQPLYKGLTTPSKAGPVWRGTVRANPDALLAPLKRKKPTTYFVNSMSDLFYEKFSDEMIDQVFAVMALTPQHTYQVLTKRAERMRAYFATADDEKLGLPKGEGERRLHIMVEAFSIREDLSKGQPLLSHSDEECCINKDRWPLPNVWLGVSAERQKEADERIPLLLQTPAAVRFVSCEPLLGALNLEPWLPWPDNAYVGDRPWGCIQCDSPCDCPTHTAVFTEREGPPDEHGVPAWITADRETLDWVIAGGESGKDARPMHPDWARSIRDQCAAAGVPFFFKQWGNWKPHKAKAGGDLGGDVRAGRVVIVHPSGRDCVEILKESNNTRQTEKGSRYMACVGKKAAGRLLDGIEHNAMPGEVRR